MADVQPAPRSKPLTKDLLPDDYKVTPEMMARARQTVEADEAKKQVPLKVFTPFPSRD